MHKTRATFQLSLLLSVFFVSSLNAQSLLVDVADNPPVPDQVESAENSPSQSVNVALVDSGVNYLLPEINEHLARDKEGKLVGYDFWDLDERPFDAHPNGRGQIQRHGTRTASLLLREAPFVKLVPYRYPRPDMSRMQELLAHAAANDVRIIGLPLGGNRIEDWQVFNEFAQKHRDILFVASAGNNGRDIDHQPVYPASLPLDNMLVVTSADDFVLPAEGVNWGRSSVDYMVPAEHQRVLRFDGSSALASGSSYAVPRVVALAARLIRDNREWQAADLIAELRRRFANGSSPAKIAQGYLHDPQVDARHEISIKNTVDWSPDTTSNFHTSESALIELKLPLDVLVLDEGWAIDDVSGVLNEAAEILSVCNVHFSDVKIRVIDAPEYLRDLESGSAKTLMDAVRLSGPQRRTTAVFANDTRMSRAFDAEAFGRANTRTRPWLTDSVWLTLELKDRGIALAHELFHVLSNSGQHSDVAGNLMLARTTGSNRALSQDQCHSARNRAIDMGLLENEG